MRVGKRLLILALIGLVTGCQKDIIDPHAANKKAVGASAHDLLAASEFTTLVVELQAMPGHAPEAASIASLKSFLEDRLNKPGGVIIKQTTAPSSGVSSYTLDEVRSVEEANRTEYNRDSTIAAYILFVDEEYQGNSGGSVTLGFAWRNTSMTIFQKSIKDLSGGIGQPSRSMLESTVLKHEIGHILGLVDVGTPMQTDHKDAQHGSHCNDSDCLMYYLAETGDIVTVLLGGAVPELDANCLADLQAHGGK